MHIELRWDNIILIAIGLGICELAEGFELALQFVNLGIIGQDLYAGFFLFVMVLDTITLLI